jgi:iron complex outermembrane receptor protein
MDWNSQTGDRLLLEGDGYISDFNESFLLPADDQFKMATRRNSEQNSGASVLARWEHDISVASKTQSQFYYEYFNEGDSEFGNEIRHTFDFDFQHDIALQKNNAFNWGLAYRFVRNSVSDSIFVTTDPTNLNLHLVSAFIQDKAIFFNDTIHLTFGTKVQYYTLSGWDYQPSIRLLWKIHSQHRLWASFSRATRSPSRGETALNLKPLPLSNSSPLKFTFQANPNFDEEQVYSYELGYRGWLNNRLSIDLAFFYNEYKDLFTGSVENLDLANDLMTLSSKNGATAKTWGIETAIDWRPIDPLRIQLSYSYLQVNHHQNNTAIEVERPQNEPKNQFSFRSSYDVSPTITFDTSAFIFSTKILTC